MTPHLNNITLGSSSYSYHNSQRFHDKIILADDDPLDL